ncbi:MAG: hypothetical protein K8R21_14645, partial [Leptospira sp.]|nr:hypothetical protein [Leptospira sp.]
MSNSFKSCSSTSPGIHNSCFAWRIQTVIAILLLFGNASISGEEDPPTAKRDIEVGIRVGPGYKAKQQFDSNLQNYTTNGTTSDLSSIDVSKFNSLTNFEFLFRRRWSSDLKFGFVIGQNNYEDISYTEIRPDRYLTQLNFSINTTYFLITYHTEWNFRNFFIEGGLGIGLGQTTWITHGFTKSPYDYVDQLGTMNGY